MANIIVRKQNGGQQLVPNMGAEWEPSRFLRDFFGWDPFREMLPIISAPERAYIPSFEVKETQDSYVFKADLPGIKEQDLEVTLTGNRLTINGKREAEKEEKSDTYYTCERSYGTFTRAFTLPDGADFDHIKSELREGVMTLVVPKKPEMQPKKISVKTMEKH